MKYNILSFLVLSALWMADLSGAAGLDQSRKDFGNQLMIKIYQEILGQKVQFKELASFDQDAFKQNAYGIASIQYQAQYPAGPSKESFEFSLTLIPSPEESIYPNSVRKIDVVFPRLGLKWSGYQRSIYGATSFDIAKLIKKYTPALEEEQQKYIPLQLSLKPFKNSFKTGEDILFEVILKNTSKLNLKVKEPDSNTMSFSYDGRKSGVVEDNPLAYKAAKTRILEPGDSLSQKFKGESFAKAKEFKIKAFYYLDFDGVQPMGSLDVKVLENSPSD